MSENRNKEAARWFYSLIGRQASSADPWESGVYRDEPIRSAPRPSTPKLPPLLMAARSMELTSITGWPAREIIFVKQAKLLANFEDDYPIPEMPARYYPTYQSLTDPELRGYFSWRAKLRHGDLQKAPSAYAFLYIYELLNQVGVTSPMEGYEKLKSFASVYGSLDETVLPYLNRWLFDYVLYYDLPQALLQDSPQAAFDRNLMVFQDIGQYDAPQIVEAVKFFAPRWLGRSRFYAQNTRDMDAVIAGVLRGIHSHFATRTKKNMVEQYFGPCRAHQVALFDSAVFLDKYKAPDREVILDPLCVYRCRNGFWTAVKYAPSSRGNPKLEGLMKTVDSVMREMYHDRHPVKPEVDTKWILSLIAGEIQRLLEEKKAQDAKKLHLNYGMLDRIREDAALTRDKLIVDEEADFSCEEPEAPAPAVESPFSDSGGSPLTPQETRFLRCLLYGGGLDWVRAEGLLLSVLTDSVNEKLYDTFGDTVLTQEDRPGVIEDYLENLKEMVPQ